MPAPTALLKGETALPEDIPLPEADHNEGNLLEEADDVLAAVKATEQVDTEMVLNEEEQPLFPAAKDAGPVARRETRKVGIPPHRMSP